MFPLIWLELRDCLTFSVVYYDALGLPRSNLSVRLDAGELSFLFLSGEVKFLSYGSESLSRAKLLSR